MADNLLPCPFCGGDNIDIIPADIIAGTQYWRIYCYGCGCTQTPISSKEEAIEKWNNRPSPWHTGTPTEEGLYAVYYLNDNNPTGEEYETLCDMFVSPVFNDGCVERWVNYNRCLVFDADEIVRWQKIEPFVEATE